MMRRAICSLVLDSFLLLLVGGLLHLACCIEEPRIQVHLGRADTLVFILVLLIAIKWVAGLDRGILFYLSATEIPVLSKCSFAVHQWFFSWRNRNVPEVVLLTGTTLVCLVAAEWGLRTFTEWLPIEWGNSLGSPYHSSGTGIYRWDPEWNMSRPRPHYERSAVMYGYRWLHRSDHWGYRNPEDWNTAQVILMGDSFIYGHGVDEKDTVRARLASLIPGQVVSNLGLQGAAIDHEYEIFKHDALRLKPEHVILFFFANDLTDLVVRLRPEEMERVLKMPLEETEKKYFDPDSGPIKRNSILEPMESLLNGTYLVRTFQYVVKKETSPPRQNYTPDLTPEGGAPEGSNKWDETVGDAADYGSTWEEAPFFKQNPPLRLAMKFHLRMLEKIHWLAEREGVHLYHVVIASPDPIVSRLLEQQCEKLDIPHLYLPPILEKAQREGKQVFLPNDGHFTGEGAQVTARKVLEHFPEIGGKPPNG